MTRLWHVLLKGSLNFVVTHFCDHSNGPIFDGANNTTCWVAVFWRHCPLVIGGWIGLPESTVEALVSATFLGKCHWTKIWILVWVRIGCPNPPNYQFIIIFPIRKSIKWIFNTNFLEKSTMERDMDGSQLGHLGHLSKNITKLDDVYPKLPNMTGPTLGRPGYTAWVCVPPLKRKPCRTKMRTSSRCSHGIHCFGWMDVTWCNMM